jgi:hypothetical protein
MIMAADFARAQIDIFGTRRLPARGASSATAYHFM